MGGSTRDRACEDLPCRGLFPDIATNVVQLPDRDILQAAAVTPQSLVDFDRRFLQHRMRFLRAAMENEVVAAGEPRVPVLGIEGQS